MASLEDIIKKRKRKKALEEDPNLELLEEITKLNVKIEQVAKDTEEVKKKVEEDRDQELELELDGSDFSHIKGDKGDTGQRGEQGQTGLPGPKSDSVQGRQGKTGSHGLRGERGIQGEIGKQGKDGKTGEDGKNPEDLEIEDIKGLKKKIKSLELRLRETRGNRLGGGGDIIKSHNLTSETDGSTKVFTIPENRNVIGVFSTQFPGIFDPDKDWTISGRTLTLTDEVGPPQTGQTLWVLYIK